MRLFTFDTSHNLGRHEGWTVEAEAARLADQGMSGLCGVILRDGFSILPTDAILYTRNTESVTLSDVCARILAGLDSRKSESGTVKPIINGTSIELVRMRLAQISDRKGAGIVVDGRRRAIASIMAYALGREDMEMHGIELTPEQAAVPEIAFRTATARDMAQKLDPWAKVEAGLRILADAPTTNEAEMMALLSVKRGDGQLIHRSATAIRKHGLSPDKSARCLNKEEWKQVADELTREGAVALLASLQTTTRAKALGWDIVSGALAVMPEGTLVDARKLGACQDRKSLDAYLATLA
jgi:hypothetical protein